VAACDQCGFDLERVEPSSIPTALRDVGPRYRSALGGADPTFLTLRPAPAVWSALEYTCHVRDVLLVQRDRAVRALVEECPTFPRMHRDERVALCRYATQPAPVALGQLETAGELLGLLFDGLDDTSASRTFRYFGTDDERRDLVWLGRYTLHECEHHLADVTDVLRRVRDGG
jgi:S-DNA-T family DNA segregation ATPase FtsK/SpoIIIE